jgi:hypothetical protein
MRTTLRIAGISSNRTSGPVLLPVSPSSRTSRQRTALGAAVQPDGSCALVPHSYRVGDDLKGLL